MFYSVFDLSTYLFIYIPIYLSNHLSILLSIYLSINSVSAYFRLALIGLNKAVCQKGLSFLESNERRAGEREKNSGHAVSLLPTFYHQSIYLCILDEYFLLQFLLNSAFLCNSLHINLFSSNLSFFYLLTRILKFQISITSGAIASALAAKGLIIGGFAKGKNIIETFSGAKRRFYKLLCPPVHFNSFLTE